MLDQIKKRIQILHFYILTHFWSNIILMPSQIFLLNKYIGKMCAVIDYSDSNFAVNPNYGSSLQWSTWVIWFNVEFPSINFEHLMQKWLICSYN